MKSFLFKFFSLVVLFFSSISFGYSAETTMRISLQLPLKSHLGQNLLLFKKEVENRSNGEIKVSYFQGRPSLNSNLNLVFLGIK